MIDYRPAQPALAQARVFAQRVLHGHACTTGGSFLRCLFGIYGDVSIFDVCISCEGRRSSGKVVSSMDIRVDSTKLGPT